MGFEDIPEDRPESFPCECGGNIMLNDEKTLWECDLCTFSRENKKIKKIDCH